MDEARFEGRAIGRRRPCRRMVSTAALGAIALFAASAAAQVCTPDTIAPVVSAPAPISVAQTLCAGGIPAARGEDSPALAIFLADGIATDDCDPAPLRQAPQVVAATADTFTAFPLGVTTVTFSWRDAGGNIGSADSTVTVILFFGDLDQNGALQAVDSVILSNFLVGNVTAGTPPFSAPAPAADLDQSTSVNAVDGVLLANRLVGNIACLPASCPAGAMRSCGTGDGLCQPGTQTCSAGVWGPCSGTMPAPEVCDGADNDCDLQIDEGCFATPICGDGARNAAGEQCDDGGSGNLDGCDASCRFEQDQRINALVAQFSTNLNCQANAFGGAFVGGPARAQLQAAIDASVANGSTSILLRMLGLDDLSGTADPALEVGVLNGTPVLPGSTPYDGTNDLDWWYLADPANLDANREPTARLAGSIFANTLNAGPGNVALTLTVGSGPVVLRMSSTRIRALNGVVSIPLASSGLPPGHLAAENLDPALQSYERSSAGELCGDISAASLAQVPIPGALVGCGVTNCSQCYTAANSMLDLMVGGCTVFFVQQIAPTQPDQEDPAAPPAGAGPAYTLQPNAATRIVDTCRDSSNAVVGLIPCLTDAAYSSFFTFTTDRVIVK